MRLCFLYHPASEHRLQVEEYAREFRRIHPSDIELISVDTRQGAELAQVYDVVQYPALLAIKDDGSLVQYWQGDTLPLMDEVASYTHQP